MITRDAVFDGENGVIYLTNVSISFICITVNPLPCRRNPGGEMTAADATNYGVTDTLADVSNNSYLLVCLYNGTSNFTMRGAKKITGNVGGTSHPEYV